MIEITITQYEMKSYDLIFFLFKILGVDRETRILDLTYGVGRFYRLVRPYLDPYIIGVDIYHHNWEVEPNMFIQDNMHRVTRRLMERRLDLGNIDLLVVDPPWESEKRGRSKKYNLGYFKMPFKVKANSKLIIKDALHLSQFLGVPLVYKYKDPISDSDLIIKYEIKVFGNVGYNYYGVVYPRV